MEVGSLVSCGSPQIWVKAKQLGRIMLKLGSPARGALNFAKSEAVCDMMSEWRDLFSSSQAYRGRQFLNLTQGRTPLAPSHLHDGPWLSIPAGKGFVPTNAFTARLT